MNRFFISISGLFIAYVTFGFYLSQFQLDLFGREIVNQNIFYNYKIHQNIYSQLSIGSGTFNSIGDELKRTQSKFVLFTDLNPVVTLDSDRYLSNTGQLFGAKILTEKHAYSIYSPKNKEVQHYSDLSDLENNLNDHLIIDHLNTGREPLTLADGIDVLNLKNLVTKTWENKKLSTIWSLIFYPFNPRLSLLRLYRDPDEELQLFDQRSRLKKVNLYLATEGTARAIPITNWLIKFPSYENVFSMASERLLMTSELSNNMEIDKFSVFNTLKNGNFYISIDTLGNSTGFETYIISKRYNKHVFMGEDFKFDPTLRLFFKLPKEPNAYHEVILYKDGRRIDHRNTSIGDFPIMGKGVYRLQVRLETNIPFPDSRKWLTWIFTNNYYIR